MGGGARRHDYEVVVEWSGNLGDGTSGYRSYARDHVVEREGKPRILGSSDPAFRGDATRWNPEELLVAALSACHQLWYLNLCSANGVVVQSYRDAAVGAMEEDEGGGGRFVDVTLRPVVGIRRGDDVELARRLHDEAHAKCFIANSVSFAIRHEPVVRQL